VAIHYHATAEGNIPFTAEEEAALQTAEAASVQAAAQTAAAVQARADILLHADQLEASGDELGAMKLRLSLMPGWPPGP